jgi:hypothetical protein
MKVEDNIESTSKYSKSNLNLNKPNKNANEELDQMGNRKFSLEKLSNSLIQKYVILLKI